MGKSLLLTSRILYLVPIGASSAVFTPGYLIAERDGDGAPALSRDFRLPAEHPRTLPTHAMPF